MKLDFPSSKIIGPFSANVPSKDEHPGPPFNQSKTGFSEDYVKAG